MTDSDTHATDADEAVYDVVVAEERVNSRLVVERTGLDADTVSTALARLVDAGAVTVVTDDLYEPTDAATPKRSSLRGIPDPNTETQTAPIDPDAVRRDSDDADD